MKLGIPVLILSALCALSGPLQAIKATVNSGEAEHNGRAAIKADTTTARADAGRTREAAALSKLPLDFIENGGQWDAAVRFMARKGPAVASFETSAIRFSFGERRPGVLALVFEGASKDGEVLGEAKRSGYYNFFFGNDPKNWRSRAAAYGGLLYHNLYDGVDMSVRQEGENLEYDLILAPDADLQKISIRADGASGFEIAGDGSLVLRTDGGQFRQTPPVTWEELPTGEKRPVECRFRKIDARRYGFEAPRRDPDLKLIIDPGLEWGTFLGGAGHDTVDSLALARDGSGDIILTGFTRSADFPATRGGLSAIGQAPFVARINSSGTALIYATMFGGSGVDSALGLAVDASSAPVVVGNTSSADFPVTPGAYDRTYNGDYDAFVARFDSTGGQMLFSTYLGGSRTNPSNPTQGYEEAWAVGVDPSGSIIVAGNTTSLNFPTTQGAYDTTANPYVDSNFDSMQDDFVARLNPTGTALTYSTYLGGQGVDYAYDMAVDSQGFVNVTGRTVPVVNRDVNGNEIPLGTPFPTTADAFDRTLNGSTDVYVARLKLDGAGASDLKYSTLMGGNDTEQASAIALDPNNEGSATIAGWTYSGNFPVTPGVLGTTHFAPLDTTMAFVARLQFPATGGGSLVWSTYLGAPGNQQADDVTVDSSGAAIVVGASSARNPLTTERAYDRTPATSDAFISRISPDASQLLYSTLLGGSTFESRLRVAYAGGSAVVVAGQTKSPDFPVTLGAYDRIYGADGGPSDFSVYDVFVAKLTLEPLETGDTTTTPPTLLSPANGASFGSPAAVSFDWSDAADPSGVEAYHIQVSPNANFTDNIIAQLNGWYETWVPDSQVGTDFPTGTFFWRVRTLDSAHNLSAWSAPRSFTVGTIAPPAAPSLLSPANNARVDQPFNFDWNDVNGAASYTIQVDNSSSFSSPLVVNQTVTTSQLTSNNLPVTTLWWRVRANNSAGTPGAWSSTRSVRVRSAPAPSSTLSTLSLNPTTVTGGNSSQATVTLTGAAPSGGAVVTLASSNSAVAGVPASVTVAAGATSATFTVTTASVSASTPVTISASFGVTRTATLTVAPPAAAVSLASLALNPASVTGGSSSQGTVTLTGAAPAGGMVVSLSSSNTAAATVPASVTVVAGASGTSFTVTTRSVTAATSVTITASQGGVTRTATLSVSPSAPTTDTVSIQRAEYSTGGRVLRVEATSNRSTATLTVHVTSTNQQIGTLKNEGGGRYRGDLSWPSNPQNITVRSSLGGSATRAVSSN